MKLKKILKDISGYKIRGSKDTEITGITANSKLVSPGNLFLVKKGQTHNGARFVPEAVSAGASAVISDIYDPFLQDVVQVVHPDVAKIEPLVAGNYYHFPDRDLLMIGITGTNGKTTSSYLIKHLLDETGTSCGLIGTIEAIVGNYYLPTSRTTPDLITTYKFLHDMRANQNKAACMEVTSHALDQGRVSNLEFDIAIFTNLTQDHLDYHPNMEEYAKAKAKLFSSLKIVHKKKRPKVAIMNQDSPWTSELLKNCGAFVLGYSIERPSDLMAEDIQLNEKGLQFTVAYQGKKHPFSSNLVGRFNVYNLLAAIACGIVLKIPMESILSALKTFKQVSGRLERVTNKKGLSVYVDYAHTDDALRNVLSTLREITKGRLITIFGCGGNRDSYKRPLMGKVAEELSDLVIVTSDNPRNESPEDIISDIMKGFQKPSSAIIEMNRFEAIKKALTVAKREDVILIAGKGHETYQIFSSQTIPFDDRKVAKEICDTIAK